MDSRLEMIYKRRSIRQYQEKTVPRELLIELTQAGMAAPSAVNKQPWQFIVVTDQPQLSALKNVLPYGKYNAPAALLVCGVPGSAHADDFGNYWVQDCSAATENILIAAVGLGLGTVWTAVFPVQERVEMVQKVLDLPPDVIPLNVILVGFPAEEKPARTQYNEKKVHWQKYN